MRRLALLLLTSLIATTVRPAPAGAASPARIDYTDPATWLCFPGRSDVCSQEITATVVGPDGTFSKRVYTADANAPVDCFYVYPTVSLEPSPNSDLTVGAEEERVARTQFARFGAKCKLYAPMYRQVTIAGLRSAVRGGASADAELAYQDVLAAWNTYLAHDNHGRGVVLIGHSQGANILTRLIASQIDGKPDQQRLISAIILGARVETPAGRDVGGSFQHVPICRSAAQTACVIAYSSFWSGGPPDSASFFGAAKPGDVDICVDPAALDGAKSLDAELPPLGPVTRSFGTIMIETPGQLTAACATTAGHTYLGVTASPGSEILVKVFRDLQAAMPGWGLHLLDVNLTLGNLVDLVGTESKAWLAHR